VSILESFNRSHPSAGLLDPTVTASLSLVSFETDVPKMSPRVHSPVQQEESEFEVSSSTNFRVDAPVALLEGKPPDNLQGKESLRF
jgi:hypothetical protein